MQSIWEYEVKDEFSAEFIEAYGFLTVDYWQSQSDLSAMKQTIGDEYDKLDKQCEAYTLSEKSRRLFQ